MYKNGLMNGPYTLWYKNEFKGEYGFHKNNKKDKLIIKWDQKGQKLSSVTFKRGSFSYGEVIFLTLMEVLNILVFTKKVVVFTVQKKVIDIKIIFQIQFMKFLKTEN